jgi:hypothetical protein
MDNVKQSFMLLLFLGMFNISFSQTSDFTISQLLKYNINKNLCPDLLNYENLFILHQDSNLCNYKCSLKNIKAEADSIILEVGLKPVFIYDSEITIELRQYYNNLDSAIIEYKEYFKSLIEELNSDTKFYKYKLTKMKDMDSTYYGAPNLWENNYIVNSIKLRSLFVRSNLYLSLIREHDKFVIFTKIY